MHHPAGKLQLHILAALAEFERERIRERIHAGLARARSQGRRLGRPRLSPSPASIHITVREAARLWGVSPATAARRINAGQVPPASETNPTNPASVFAFCWLPLAAPCHYPHPKRVRSVR